MAQSNYNNPHQASAFSYNASHSSFVPAEGGLQSGSDPFLNPNNYHSHLGCVWNPDLIWNHQYQNQVVPPYSSNLYCENSVASATKIEEGMHPSTNISKLPKLTKSQEQWLSHVKQCKMDQKFVNQFIHSKLVRAHQETLSENNSTCGKIVSVRI